MPNINSLSKKLDIAPLRDQLEANPDVWNLYPWRTQHPRSPHREVSDIWVRYNDVRNLGPHFNDPHESVWYPVAERIGFVKSLVAEVMDHVGLSVLGGVLITRVPAGKQVYPHVDQGWHARSHEKFAVQIAGNAEQSFCFEHERLSAQPGDLYWFRNDVPHWVLNPSLEDRITLIICLRSQ